MNWRDLNKNKYLKWALFFALFFFGLFCYMKDYGYAEESQYSSKKFSFLKREFLSSKNIYFSIQILF